MRQLLLLLAHFAVLALTASGVWAAEAPPHKKASCAWALAAHYSKQEIASLDPSDASALQDLLQRIYAEPERKLGAQDRWWVSTFKLENAVNEVRSAGRELASRNRWMAIKRKGGSGRRPELPVLILGKYALQIQTEQANLMSDLNQEYGLQLTEAHLAELRL